ncbi:unnamed protein product [Schistosoma mattheei]|uniref:Uncharacterized protein n=1 Tax=Schistosoma mattheei TaxID=31246 RepID=A0A183NGM3_9TREM|nr:unnamed protein product [Schistosoma mattheei]
MSNLIRRSKMKSSDMPLVKSLQETISDSRFTVIREANSICPDLLSSRLLIMEATYLDNPDRKIESARSHGHTHLDEIRQNACLLKSVDYIYLIHFSDRYGHNDIIRLCHKDMPDWLVNRIIPSVTAKHCLESNNNNNNNNNNNCSIYKFIVE